MNKVTISPITQEELKNAQAIIAQATAQGVQSASDHVDPVNPPAQSNVTVSVSLPVASPTLEVPAMSGAMVGINEVKKQALRDKLEETINNPRFWAKEIRYDSVMSALVVPVFDDKSLQMFYNHAQDDLTTEAAKKSCESGVPVVMPTEDEIKAEVWIRYTGKLIELEKKALTKSRKRDAEDNGTTFVRVTNEDVMPTVEQAVQKLRASENC